MPVQEVSLFEEAPDTAMSGLYAEIVFDRPLDHAYTYAVPPGLADAVTVGKRVLAPFGKGDRQTVGFCVGVTEKAPERAVKAIVQVLDAESLLPDSLLKLTRWMADYYLCGWGQVLNAVVPAAAKQLAGTKQVPLVELIPEVFWPKPTPPLPAKQKALLELLTKHAGAVEARQLLAEANSGSGPLRALIEKGLVRRKVGRIENPVTLVEEDPEPETVVEKPNLTLTEDQLRVWAVLEQAVRTGGFQPFLLHGVTGSGKTELYLRAIEEVIRQGKEALVLVPEISLTPQTIAAFKGRCGHVAVLHSHLHDAQRGAHWRRITQGKVEVIVGARSAVFAPTRNLGLIVIDEEHESSFKQDATPRYHGRDVAVMRARLENIPIILGSATPALESWHNAERGQYTLLSLPKRVAERPLPPVKLIDLRYDRHPDKRFHGISPTLERAMKHALDTKGQVILLLNRRGFATHLLCPACGHVEQCKFCDLAMIFHKDRNVAMCHYCGYEAKPVEKCPHCGMGQVKYQGMGTEKLEAEIASKFRGFRMARMDSDTMQKPGSHRRVLKAFERGEIDILLGTQMIAKGLDFPNVTMVGVINADIGLHQADFRAAERTFQLLAQVAGRTGRGPRGGSVFVQTFQPDHPCIGLASQHDFLTFAKGELEVRRQHHYPPFQRFARLVIRGKDEKTASDYADLLAAAFKPALESMQSAGETSDLRILGPAEAPIFRLKGYYRFHFQLQSPSSAYLHRVLRQVIPSVRVPANVDLTVDIDPQDMM